MIALTVGGSYILDSEYLRGIGFGMFITLLINEINFVNLSKEFSK
jgi:hypothetical protein